KYGSRDKYQILTCFDKCNFKQGQSFEARVTQIYDPTKFWIVSKFRELEVFQKYLFRFYYLNSSNYKIPHDKIAIDLYCMCFIENAYYRGVIVGFPIRHHDAEQEVQVFLIDYGMLKIIDINNIYYISEECLRVPQFVVRASLAGIRPLNDHWTTQDVDRFYDLVTDKIIKVNVIDIDCKRKILKVFINIKDDNSMISVQETLLTENYAAYIRDKEKTVKTIQTLGFKSPYLLQGGVALINSLNRTKFSLLLKHIVKSEKEELFTQEELVKLSESLKLDETNLQLLIQSIAYIFKQSSKVILKPTVLQEQLVEHLKFNPEKAEDFVKLWTEETNQVFDLKNSHNLENISWELNIQTASTLCNKEQHLNTRLQMGLVSVDGKEKENVILELDEEELLHLYNVLENVQSKLDNI
ncbi:uncharacterized protein BDFB_001361, partial [Asbolus verrucosus]